MFALTLPRVRSTVLPKVIGVALFAVLTAISARLTVLLPFTPVPLTLQVMVVVLSGLMLGPWGGFAAQALVLQAILLGAPLTASGLSGVAALVSPTAGYLVAFPFAAALAGWVAHRPGGRGLVRHLLAGGDALALIYALGTAWLATYVGARNAWALGAAPFALADAMKIMVAAGATSLRRK